MLFQKKTNYVIHSEKQSFIHLFFKMNVIRLCKNIKTPAYLLVNQSTIRKQTKRFTTLQQAGQKNGRPLKFKVQTGGI